MSYKDELKKKLKQISGESVAKTDSLLAEELDALKGITRTDLDKLRPKITDQATYSQLIAIVETTTQKNISVAELKAKVETLGEKGIAVVKEVVKIWKAV